MMVLRVFYNDEAPAFVAVTARPCCIHNFRTQSNTEYERLFRNRLHL